MSELSKKSENRQFYKKMLWIAGPVMLQQAINLSVNLTDNIMVGKLQEEAISGVALGNQFYFLFQIFCMGLGGGSAVMVGQLWGKKDVERIRKVITLMLRICIGVALAFTFATWFLTPQIMGIYTPHAGIIAEGVKYLRVMAFVFLIHGVALNLTIVYRAAGVVWLAMISSLCSFGLNIFFNWVFIFGNLGAPKMGVAGAALGTLIARALEFLIVVIYLLVKEKGVQYKLRYLFQPCLEVFKDFGRLSVPVIISDIMLQLGNNMIAIIMGHMPNEKIMVSANNITANSVQLCTFMILGLSNAASVMIGNSIGEGKTDVAISNGRRFFKFSIIAGVFAAGLIHLLGPIVLSFYEVSEETIACTRQLINAISFIMVFQTISSVLTKGVLRGGGDTKFLMMADVLFLWIASVPLGFLAGITFELSAFWVYIAMKIDMVIKAIWCAFRLYKNKWIKKVSTI